MSNTKPSQTTLRQIHFCNDDGFIHYASTVLDDGERADCRVYDCCKTLADLQNDTVGIHPGRYKDISRWEGKLRDPEIRKEFGQECLKVAQAVPTWLNNIWLQSPFRDGSLWKGGLQEEWKADLARRRKHFIQTGEVLPMKVKV